MDAVEVEAAIARDLRAGDHAAAATRTLEAYGPEVYGLLVSMHRSAEHAAGDVFSIWSERLWRSLEKGSWQKGCSMRTWAYRLVRNASANYNRGERRRQKKEVAIGSDAYRNVAANVRTATASYLRTESKEKLARIRESLPPEDQMILVLRLDKQMEWSDLARVMLAGAGGDGDPDDDADVSTPSEADLKRESARIRKRFQVVKERLLEMGREQGLFRTDGTDRDRGRGGGGGGGGGGAA